MTLQGIRTIYDSEVAFIPGEGFAPTGLNSQSMSTFCSVSDAEQIFAIARQVVPQAKLVGATGNFTVSYNPNTNILMPGPDQLTSPGVSGGSYLYRTADGYRPMKIQSPGDGLDQFVSDLVASYNGQTGMVLKATAQGNKLLWA